jgi:polysaccharide pyruvyl transferase WcaK-like protein
VGIGVGSFTKSSRKYYQKITELASVKMIMVRDQESFKRLEDLDLPGSLIMGADLAFFSSYWMTSSDSFSKSRLRIGFVIKYMEIQEGYLDVIRQAAFTFQNEGIEVVIFSFEKNHDHMLAQFFHEFKIIWWSPSTLTVDEYMEEFSDCSLLVTSRAHGAILGAAFGIPSICIGIEPKLKQVSKMFPNSGMYVSLPLTFDMLYDKIKVGMTIAYDRVIMDFELNKAKLDKSISEFRQFLYSYCKSDET